MTENRTDTQGREWEIPLCAAEIRVASDSDRTSRNPDSRKRRNGDFELVSYTAWHDGEMQVTCSGNEECRGGTVNVDRHDLQQPTMPDATVALRGICAARTMFYSRNGVLRSHEVTE